MLELNGMSFWRACWREWDELLAGPVMCSATVQGRAGVCIVHSGEGKGRLGGWSCAEHCQRL